MAEEQSTEKQVEQVEQQQQQEEAEVKLSPKEQQAYDLGWRPKDEYEGDPEEWVGANEFLKRGELFGRINSYKHELDDLRKVVKAQAEHNRRMFETQYTKQIKELKDARKTALREGDTEVVVELDDKLEEVQQEFEEKKEELKQEQQQQAGPHPAFGPWIESNRWYQSDEELRGYADGVANKIVKDAREVGAQVDFPKLLTEVARKVKQRFPEKFPSQGERKRTVERASGEAQQRGNGLADDLRQVEKSLDETEVQIMKTLVDSKVMTKAEYLKQVKELNQRKGYK